MNEGAWLLATASRTPQAPALESEGRSMSFAELAALAREGAATLLQHAPPGSEPLALLLVEPMGFARWFHAGVLAGRALLPLNARLTGPELAQQLADAGVRWLLGEAGDPRLAELGQRLPALQVLTREELERQPSVRPAPTGRRVADSDTLAVMFTSGTGGRARGACLSGGAFAASAAASRERLGEAVAGRWLACMPLFHVGGLSILLRSAMFGGAVRLQQRFDAAAVSDALDGGDIAGMSLVPTMLSRLLTWRGDRPAPAALRVLLLGGASAPPALIRRALELGYPVCPTYGLTESCSQAATSAPPACAARRAAPMLPLDGIEIAIEEDGRRLPAGEAGEILLRGPMIMQGYLNDAAATARTLRGGWLYTGDIGCLDPDGGLRVFDRRDDLVISGGENVYPAEVEAVLLEHPAVAEAGVAGLSDDDLGRRVVAWVVMRANAVPDAASLERHCRERLAGFKRPREFRWVTALPRNAAGKLERRRLAEISRDD